MDVLQVSGIVPINANAMEEKLKHFTLPNGRMSLLKRTTPVKWLPYSFAMVGSADEEIR
jgi:hypothetical protein